MRLRQCPDFREEFLNETGAFVSHQAVPVYLPDLPVFPYQHGAQDNSSLPGSGITRILRGAHGSRPVRGSP